MPSNDFEAFNQALSTASFCSSSEGLRPDSPACHLLPPWAGHPCGHRAGGEEVNRSHFPFTACLQLLSPTATGTDGTYILEKRSRWLQHNLNKTPRLKYSHLSSVKYLSGFSIFKTPKQILVRSQVREHTTRAVFLNLFFIVPSSRYTFSPNCPPARKF